MSKATDVFDALVARVAAVLPDHKRIPNPYIIEQNSERILNKGQGVTFGPGENTFRRLTNQLSVARDFSVIITRKSIKKETDSSGRAEDIQLLFEDQKLVIDDVEKNTTLLDSTLSVAKSDYLSDNGLEFIYGEKDNFIKVESVIRVEYIEDLTC